MRKTENIYNTTLEILILHLQKHDNTSGSFDDSSKQNQRKLENIKIVFSVQLFIQ
jgi:hypothetical protein